MAWTDDGFQTAEKSARSVFVGNIPYDTSEEQLKASSIVRSACLFVNLNVDLSNDLFDDLHYW